MKVTYKSDYALKAVLDLALHYNRDLVTSHDIAQRIDAPLKFLEQILLDLKKGGFVESRRGKVGGYLLTKAPGQITVGEVIRFIEGDIEPISCVKQEYSDCRDIHKCVFRKMWQDVSKATSNIIDKVNFEDIANKAKGMGRAVIYQI